MHDMVLSRVPLSLSLSPSPSPTPSLTPLPTSLSLSKYIYIYILYQDDSSKLHPRKVELASAHKNAMTTMSIIHITTELVNIPTKQPYRTNIFIS